MVEPEIDSKVLEDALFIQNKMEERRLEKVKKTSTIFPLLVILPAFIGLGLIAYYFEQDLVPRVATQAIAAEDITKVVPLTIPETRFNPLQTPQPEPAAPVKQVWVPQDSSEKAWSEINPTAEGLLTFRGNPTRTFHGLGPFPTNPETSWTKTISCSISPTKDEENKEWCGTGWTGQPVVFPSPKQTDKWWVAVGGYNKNVNFMDPETGEQVFPDYETNDIIKGTVTVDPDGFPILYTGSRDNFFHIVSLDGDSPETLWQLSAESDQATFWNNDWDGSAMVIDDYLFLGGENSRFYIIKLNRKYDANGKVSVDPVEVFSTQGWDKQLLSDLGDTQVSIENSVAISENTVYFANSGGLVQGWDISELKQGEEPERVFRFWTGDDTDSTIVIDKEGYLYVTSQYERETERSKEVGQIMKLDPSKPEEPLVWSRQANSGKDTGIWATPAIYKDQLIVATKTGELMGLDRDNGKTIWEIEFNTNLWSSPVVINNKLLQADCRGNLTLYNLDTNNQSPDLIWRYEIAKGACIESTPAVWDGRIFVGLRNGLFYGLD